MEAWTIMHSQLPSATRLLFLDLAWLISRTGLFQPPGMRGGCIGSGEEAALPCLRLEHECLLTILWAVPVIGTALLRWQLPHLELVAGDATP